MGTGLLYWGTSVQLLQGRGSSVFIKGANWGHVPHARSTTQPPTVCVPEARWFSFALLLYGFNSSTQEFSFGFADKETKSEKRRTRGVCHVMSVVTIAWPASYSGSDGRLTVLSSLSNRPTTPAISLIFTRLLN